MSLFGTPQGQTPSQPFNLGSSSFGGSMFGGSMFGGSQAAGQQGPSGTGTGFGLGSAFVSGTGGSMFGSSTPAFGGAASTPSMFGLSTPQSGGGLFGSTPTFGQTGGAFGLSPSPLGQGTSSIFGQPQQFGSQQGSIFGQSPGFGQTQASPFGQSPFGQSQAQSPFAQPFGQTSSMFGTPQLMMNQSPHLTTQMAPVAPLVIPLPDREVQSLIDAYKDEPGNPRYGFRHLLLSVTDPSARVKPVGVSDIMWVEAMNKLDGMDSADRDRLWPEVVYGFKDLSTRLKLQDEAIGADVQRLQATETNVKLLHRHFDTDTLPWIRRLRLKEQELQRRLLKAMKYVEALEGKGFRMGLTRGETKLGEQLRTLTQQLQGAIAEIPRRVEGLLSQSRMQADTGQCSVMLLLGPGKIDEQGMSNMQEVLRQQTEAISHLTGVLKRDVRDMGIILSENADSTFEGNINFRRVYA